VQGCALGPLCAGDSRKQPRSKETTGKHSRRSNPVLWACQDLNQRPHPYQRSRAKRCADRRFPRSLASVRGEGMRSSWLRSQRCRQARLAHTPIRGTSISPRPLWRPGLLMLGPARPDGAVLVQGWRRPQCRHPEDVATAQRPKPLQRAIPTPAWPGGQRPHGRAATSCPAHRRLLGRPPTRTSPPDQADAAGVVSGLPGGTLSGQSWWQVAQPRASSPAAPNTAPG
jgi:hypothetical protein